MRKGRRQQGLRGIEREDEIKFYGSGDENDGKILGGNEDGRAEEIGLRKSSQHLTITDESDVLREEGKEVVLIVDSLATSSKITVEMRSDGLGGSLYGSINSSVRKVEKINSGSGFSSIAQSSFKDS